MRKKHIVLKAVTLVVISLVIGCSAYSWNARTIGHDLMPMPFGTGLSVVLSGSMEPTLSVDDLVVIRKAEVYEKGDVVVYQSGNSLVIHRIIETDGTTVVSQGDANNVADEPFPIYMIKGRMVKVFPGLGKIVQVLQSTPVKIIIILLAGFLFIRAGRIEEAAEDPETEQIRQEIEKLKAEMLAAANQDKKS